MQSGEFTGWGIAATGLDQNSQIEGVTDFNSDGFADLLVSDVRSGASLYAAQGADGFDHWAIVI
jgi:hypothetical protein